MGYDHWMTPPNEIALAMEYMGSIDYDPASNEVSQVYVRARTFAVAPTDTIRYPYQFGHRIVNGLSTSWAGNVWLNPPYSAGLIDQFVDKAISEWNGFRWSKNLSHKLFPIQKMLILVNSQTDTKWYHKLLGNATAALFYRGRLKYWKIFNNQAHEKWEGEKSIAEGRGKVGNSPRYLNTLFLFDRDSYALSRFTEFYGHKGIIVTKWTKDT
jgi:DNA N-6-adenine-methyltransferase (Dam)